ncbi:MAG: hypothetical protein M3N26_12195 [Pseudomonadota bacterium]|nr:hypothetical protein [Pseudomonadota bacterium]
MQIGPIAPVLPTANTAVAPQAPVPKPAPKDVLKPAPFDPNPALRPTLQDRIDVNRTLRLLREV